MPNLITPSLGDYFDRLTILALKVQYGLEKQVPTAHFEEEQAAIIAAINADRHTHGKGWPSEVSRLREVNVDLWQMTDELRESLRVGGARSVTVQAALGRNILRANDERGRLIEAINAYYGDVRPAEKIPA